MSGVWIPRTEGARGPFSPRAAPGNPGDAFESHREEEFGRDGEADRGGAQRHQQRGRGPTRDRVVRPPRGRRPRPHAAGAGGTDSRTPAAERLRIRRAVRGSPRDVPADSAPRLGLGLPQAPWVTSRRCLRGAGQGEGGREAVWERATREACGSTRCPLPRPPLPRPSSVRNQESRGGGATGERASGPPATPGSCGLASARASTHGAPRRLAEEPGCELRASRYFCSFWRRSPGPFENSSVGQNDSL